MFYAVESNAITITIRTRWRFDHAALTTCIRLALNNSSASWWYSMADRLKRLLEQAFQTDAVTINFINFCDACVRQWHASYTGVWQGAFPGRHVVIARIYLWSQCECIECKWRIPRNLPTTKKEVWNIKIVNRFQIVAGIIHYNSYTIPDLKSYSKLKLMIHLENGAMIIRPTQENFGSQKNNYLTE